MAWLLSFLLIGLSLCSKEVSVWGELEYVILQPKEGDFSELSIIVYAKEYTY